MRTFHLQRHEDESGVSGTGMVAEGIEFSNGKVCVAWLSKVRSETIYDSIEEVAQIHGHGGKTELVFHTTDYVSLQESVDKLSFLLMDFPVQLARCFGPP